MMDGSWYGWGWGWMMLMPLVWAGLVGLVVWALIQIAPQTGRGGGRGQGADRGEPSRETPREVLDRRLASGEIDLDTYAETRARLEERDSAAP